MSIASEISRIEGAKNTLKTKLNAKNDQEHQITDETIDEYGDFIDTISTGKLTNEEYNEADEDVDDILENTTIPSGTISITENGEYDVTNYINANVNVASKLPYTQLEYIESTGTQYIDLGIVPTTGLKFEIDYQFLDYWYQDGTPFDNQIGCGEYNNTKRFTINYPINDTNFSFGLGTNQSSSVNKDINRHTFKIDLYNWTFGVDNSIQSFSQVNFNTALTFTLFARKLANEYSFMGNSRFYGAKIYFNGYKIYDYIPVKDTNGVICIYDKVNEIYKYNNGTGTFIAGEEV